MSHNREGSMYRVSSLYEHAQGPIDTAGRVIATPVAITFDAAATVVAIPLFALFMVSYGLTEP